MPLALRSQGTISVPKVMPAVDCGSTLPCDPTPEKSLNSLPEARIDWRQYAMK